MPILKRGAYPIAIASLLLATTVPGAPSFGSRPKVLVQDLVAHGVEAHEAAILSTATCQAFAKANDLEVLCGEDIRNLIKLGAIAAAFDGCRDEKCHADLGRAMRARYVVSGAVGKLGGGYVLTLSVLDAIDGRAVGRAEVKAESVEKLHGHVPEAVSAARAAR